MLKLGDKFWLTIDVHIEEFGSLGISYEILKNGCEGVNTNIVFDIPLRVYQIRLRFDKDVFYKVDTDYKGGNISSDFIYKYANYLKSLELERKLS